MPAKHPLDVSDTDRALMPPDAPQPAHAAPPGEGMAALATFSEPISAEVPASSPEPGDPWRRLPSGRWAVGDEGRQEEITPLPGPPLRRPDTIIDGGMVNSLTFRAASLRGLSHQQYARPRQDSYAYRLSRNGTWLVACVADGVSEGRWSHEAADIACTVLTEQLLDEVQELDVPLNHRWPSIAARLPWEHAVEIANDAMVTSATARLRELYLRDGNEAKADSLNDGAVGTSEVARLMSTTAIALVTSTLVNDNGGHPYTIAVAAGDSSAFVLSDGGWSAVTAVKNAGADIASSAVHPLPGKQPVQLHHGSLHRGDCLAVMTDGLGDPLGAGQGAVGRFLGTFWRQPPDLLSFAEHVGFLRKTFVDDRTAFAVWADPPG